MKTKPYAAVIGLGLIGGSAAQCLKENYQVIGYDTNSETLRQALRTGVITEGYPAPNSRLTACDLVYLAAPVNICCQLCSVLPDFVGETTVVTDLCSTKREILHKAEEAHLRFVGGHPMAGSEQSGFTASHPDLMENAYYLIVPLHPKDQEATDLITEIAENTFRAIPLELSPQMHDRAVGLISHLPHALAVSLVNLVRVQDTPDHLLQKIAAGGFRDITRIASSDPFLWNTICSGNHDILADLLEQTAHSLTDFSDRLRKQLPVTELFRNAKQYRDEIESGLKNERGYELMMDVEDKPGVIADVSTLLSQAGINIINISISNSREYEGGILRVRIKRRQDVELAKQILNQNGYDAISK